MRPVCTNSCTSVDGYPNQWLVVGTCLRRYSWLGQLGPVPQHSRRRCNSGDQPDEVAAVVLVCVGLWVGSRCGSRPGDLAWPVCRQCTLLASPRQCYPSHSICRSVAQRRRQWSGDCTASIANQSVFTAANCGLPVTPNLPANIPHLLRQASSSTQA